MNNKSIIIANNNNTSKQLESWVTQQMPQLKLVGITNNTNEALKLLKQKQPQLVFVNLQDLTTEDFLQLQQIKHPTCSIVFVPPKFMENSLTLPQKVLNSRKTKATIVKLKIENVIKHIPASKIMRLEACSNYTKVYFNNNAQPILTSKTLKFYADQLDSDFFVRPHQSHLVNYNSIQELVFKASNYLLLKDGTKICIARRRLKAFKNKKVNFMS